MSALAARPDPKVEQLLTQAQGDSAGARISALKRLARLNAPEASASLLSRLEGLHPADPEAQALLALWQARPYGKTAARTSEWVVRALPATTSVTWPRLGPRTVAEATLLLAAQILADRSDQPGTHSGLAVLSVHSDEQIARVAADGLVSAQQLDAKAYLPQLVLMLNGGDPQLEDRALVLLGRSHLQAAIEPVLVAAERAADRGDQGAHLAALRGLTGQKLPTVAAYRAWWSRQRH